MGPGPTARPMPRRQTVEAEEEEEDDDEGKGQRGDRPAGALHGREGMSQGHSGGDGW